MFDSQPQQTNYLPRIFLLLKPLFDTRHTIHVPTRKTAEFIRQWKKKFQNKKQTGHADHYEKDINL